MEGDIEEALGRELQESEIFSKNTSWADSGPIYKGS